MSYMLTFTATSPIIAALAADYSVDEDARTYTAETRLGETVVAFVSYDGSATVLVVGDPEGYIRDRLNGYDVAADEFEAEEGTFDPSRDTIEIKARSAFV